jgi:hypothetical protein
MYTRHLRCIWNTSQLHVFAIYAQAFVPQWHQHLYPALEEVCAKQQASVTRRWHLASRRRLLQIAYQIGPSEGFQRDGSLRTRDGVCKEVGPTVHNRSAGTTRQVWFAVCVRKDFHFFRSPKKQLVGKRFATDAEVKQAVTSRLRDLETDFL